MAVELLARGARRDDGHVPDDREDVQGPDRCGVRGDDGPVARARDVGGAVGVPCPAGGRRRGRPQRDPAEPALPERVRPALRADRPHPGRQGAAGRRHVLGAEGTVCEAVRAEGPRARGTLAAGVVSRTPPEGPWVRAIYLYLEV